MNSIVPVIENENDVLLSVEGLQTRFATDAGEVRAVDGVSLTVRRGETLALVGESGCGKSVSALSIMRLIPDPPGRISGGRIVFRDDSMDQPCDLLTLSDEQMRRIRGNRIAMIFQEPINALNPVFTVGEQIAEAVELHQKVGRRAARDAAVSMLRKVGIGDPETRVNEYPHRLSGGMRQRVMIAMALSCNPSLLIADEPTTALDVTVQAQILDLLRSLQRADGMSVLMITHDLGVVAETADRVCVMYAGRIVESADVAELFANPLHPYTQGLLRCLPRMTDVRERLEVIPGGVPNPLRMPEGCRFHPRCRLTIERAASERRPTCLVRRGGESLRVLEQCVRCGDDQPGGDPSLRQVTPGHFVACWEAPGYDRGAKG